MLLSSVATEVLKPRGRILGRSSYFCRALPSEAGAWGSDMGLRVSVVVSRHVGTPRRTRGGPPVGPTPPISTRYCSIPVVSGVSADCATWKQQVKNDSNRMVNTLVAVESDGTRRLN